MNLREHLKQRHLNFDLHQPVLDVKENVATFYLWNLSGQMVGYHQYRPLATKEKRNDPKSGRYFTICKAQSVALFGTESLHLTPHVVFVTEGVFDAARLTDKGISAIAVLCNDPKSDIKNFLRSLGRKIVCVCDNDKAGRKLATLGDVSIFTEDKDLSDSSDEFVNSIMNHL